MKRKSIDVIGVLVSICILLHSMPALALRTSIFFHGFPIAAFTTEIQEYEPYSPLDKKLLQEENTKLYRLTPPPVEKSTKGHLYTWKVSKKVFIYVASYYGEG